MPPPPRQRSGSGEPPRPQRSGSGASVEDCTLGNGTYTFGERLGSGTSGVVYLGRLARPHPSLPAVAAIKSVSYHSQGVGNLIEEVQLLKRLSHPYIIKFYDLYVEGTTVHLIFEWANGGSLYEHIQRRQSLNELITQHFLRQLASALEYMHSKQVAHLDLKPHNLLLCRRPNRPSVLKVADFGFAVKFTALKGDGGLRGSPLYMAPEILMSKKYDARVDLWSIGVILHEALYGRAPFHSRSNDELIAKITSDEPISLPGTPALSSTCKELLGGLLQRDPAKRMSFAAFFAHEFVDLAHCPSERSLAMARVTVKNAIARDTSRDYERAMALYSDALKHFAAAIDFEADGGRSERLRTGVQQYVERHRTLKGLLQQHSFDALVALEDTWEEVLTDTSLPPAFRLECEHAHQSLMQAQHHDKEQRYTRAFAMYERGLEVLAACLRDNKGVIPQKTADDVTTILMRGLDRAEDVKARLAHFAGPLSEAFSLGSRDAGTGGALAKDSRCTIS